MSANQDELLHALLPLLAKKGMARIWAQSCTPFSDLERDCVTIAADVTLHDQFAGYLKQNPLVSRTVRSFLEHYSSAAFARAENIPGPARFTAQRGVYLGLWIPTFLVIDGPFARFIRAPDSPLNIALRQRHADFRTLAQARDFLNHNLFRLVRNGIAHWSFVFDIRENRERLICFDPDTGLETVDLDVLEANALHAASLAIVDCIDNKIFRSVGHA